MIGALFVRLTVNGDEYLFSQAADTIEADAIPSIQSVSVTPAVIDPGRSIGQRESVSVKFGDHLHVFDTDAYDAGTFWTKFRARYVAITGSTLLVYRGVRGQALADMERRLYIVDSLQVAANGATITAKDPLTLILSSAAQAPLLSTGELSASIAAGAGSLTLAPAGIGDLEYPVAGRVCIGGSEIATFTRSGDVLTLTARGVNLGGTGEEHDDESKVQLVLEYSSQSPSEIVNDLLTNYTDIDPDWITLSDWEVLDNHVGNLYSAQIAAPESVTKLLDELSEQVGMTIYWDAVAQKLRLVSLAPSGNSYAVNENNIRADSFEVSEQPDKRVSQPWIYYGMKNTAEKVDEVSNYRRAAVEVADNQSDYAQVAIHKIYSRWISIANQPAATRLCEMLIARYKVPPRRFRFSLFRSGETLPRLGAGVTISHRRLVDGDGLPLSIPAQLISEAGSDEAVTYEAEEINYDGSADTTKYVVLDSGSSSINLRYLFDTLYGSVGDSDTVEFTVPTGAIIQGDAFNWVITVGSWPAGVTLTLTVNGMIYSPSVVYDYGSPFSYESIGLGITTGRAITIINNGSIIAESSGSGGPGQAIDGWGYVTYSGGGVLTGTVS